MPIRFYLTGSYVLSNFSPHAVAYDGQTYPTAEHAYQAAKFQDQKIKINIREAGSPLQAKELANKTHKDQRYPDWAGRKLHVMEAILHAKLAQHSEVAQFLRQSANQELVEDSPVDYFWGCGQDGTGQNMLGKLWMQLRSQA